MLHVHCIDLFLVEAADESVKTNVIESIRAILIVYSRIDKHKTAAIVDILNLKLFFFVVFSIHYFIIDDIIFVGIYV